MDQQVNKTHPQKLKCSKVNFLLLKVKHFCDGRTQTGKERCPLSSQSKVIKGMNIKGRNVERKALRGLKLR